MPQPKVMLPSLPFCLSDFSLPLISPARRPHSRLLLDELRRERGASSERFPSAEGDGEREAEGGGATADDDDDDDAGCGRVWRQEA